MDRHGEPPSHGMTSDAFIAWAMEQPEGHHYQLEKGRVVRQPAQDLAHVRIKGRMARALTRAVARSGCPCEAFPGGLAVEVGPDTVLEPDASVRCGDPLPGEAVKVTDPLIVVEVASVATEDRDTSTKRVEYFRLPSVRHYLIAHPGKRVVVHHSRADGAAEIATRIVGSGALRLDPPGLELDVPSLFPDV